MALSPKQREQIIEEETLRFETRRNLELQHKARGAVRWPWILAGALLVYLAYCHIFCGEVFYGRGCSYHHMESGEEMEAPAKK